MHKHRWGRWEDGEAVYGGPFTKDYEVAVQVRTCETCNKRKVRRIR